MRNRHNLSRSRCTSSALALATVLAIGATPAKAQSLQGTGTFVTNTGGAADITPGVNTTTVTLNPGQTVIDWTPFDNAVGNFGGIGFQYDGTTATFQSSGNFAVLNRINVADVTRVISMDGDINGLVGGQTGGSIYFYSPSGFVLGANATINVGSLVLSASPITVDGNGLFITGPNNSVTFGQTVNPNAAVNTVGAFGLSPGAIVNASDYVAFVAPRVEHQGTINVAGQAALVAAEAATIDFTPDGLFNIQITSGTTDSEGVRIGGDINGPASDGSTNHRIYAVAVPKNQLITMTIATGANLGFDIAGAANVDGNAIVLSAGNNISGGQVGAVAAGNGAGEDWIIIGGVTVTSAFTAQAQSRVHMFTPTNTASTFASNVSLIGPVSAYANAEASGASLTIQGDLLVTSSPANLIAGANVTGGQAQVYAVNGGIVTVNGDTQIYAEGSGGGASADNVNGGIGTGGSASAFASGGTSSLQFNGDLTVRADGLGGGASGVNSVGGAGRGGSASVSAGGGGDVSIAGTATVTANGIGGTGRVGGGLGDGGTASIQALSAGSSVTIDTDALVIADGNGGSSNCTLCGGFGGGGFGGDAYLATQSGAAGNLATLSVEGSSYVSTNASGGQGDATGGSAIGGGVAGSSVDGAVVTFAANSSINLTGGLTIESNGSGGNSNGVGGNGTGGRARTGAQNAATGGSLTIGGLLESSVRGFGGDGGSGNGGIGRGGQSDNGGNSGTINYNNVNILADAFGGSSGGGTGGAAFGGTGWIDAFGSAITITGYYSGFAQASGGNGSNGGAATGGSIFLVGRSGLTVGGTVELYADAGGGVGFNGNGGNATGGTADVRAQTGATMAIASDVFVYAEATGGDASGTGTGGSATGGNALVRGLTGSNLDVLGDAYIYANAFGGSSDLTGASGSATAGTASLAANAASVDVGGSAYLGSNGYGGSNGECFSCGGTPGNGNGGVAQVFSTGSGAQMSVTGDAFITSNGYGGRSGIGLGGNGTGGSAYLTANAGSTTTILGSAYLDAQGYGASVSTFGTGGNGQGGLTQVANNAIGSSVIVGGDVGLDSSGFGGGTLESSGAAGGSGTGGNAFITVMEGIVDFNSGLTMAANGRGGSLIDGIGGDGTGGATSIYAQTGILTIGSSVDHNAALSATGQGGSSFDGTGGNGLGGFNGVEVNGTGSITMSANLSLDGSSSGGNGTVGGSATGRTTPTTNELQPDAGTILVRGPGGGSISIAGSASLNADARGGNGTDGESQGNGGSAVAGELDVNATNGTLSVSGVTISATAYGGQGGFSANGGDATGGRFDVTFGPSPTAMDGTMTLGAVAITANAIGGQGGNGLDGLTGGNGGAGGNASISIDSSNQFTANAAGGTLNATDVVIVVQAFGGDGGNGGIGADGAGGTGGAGGSAEGGRVQTGSISSNLVPSSGGAFTVGTLSVDTSIFGGEGGIGGNGTTAGGSGGNGGSAGTVTPGFSLFTLRGMTGTVSDLTLIANSTGGNGGFAGSGTTSDGLVGNGGDAVGGVLVVESRERFAVPTQRANLVAGDIYGESIAIGGNGTIAGTSTAGGDNSFRLSNGDATIGSFQFVIQGDNPSATRDFIAVVDGTASISGDFSFTTPNALALYANRTNTTLDQASLSAGTMTLDAGTFIPFPGDDTMGTEADPAARPGTFAAGTFAITTGANFYTTATLDSGTDLVIDAPGSISTGDIIGGGSVDLLAQGGDLTTLAIDAANDIRLFATGGITTATLDAGGLVDINGGSVSVTDIISGSSTSIDAGSIAFASIQSGGSTLLNSGAGINGGTIDSGLDLQLQALGNVTLGTVTVARDIFASATGAVDIGDVTVGDDFDLSGGSITYTTITGTGAFAPPNPISLISDTTITGGDINSNTQVALFAQGNIDVGNLTGGTSVIVNTDSGGAIQVGNVDAGTFVQLDAIGGGSIAGGTVSAGTTLSAVSASSITLGALDAGTSITLQSNSGPIVTGNATAGTTLFATSNGNVTMGNLVAGTLIDIGTNGAMQVGDMTSGGAIDARSALTGTYGNIVAADGLYVGATGALSFGTMTAGETARFGSDTSVLGGNVTAGDSVIGTSGGAITLGNLSAGIVNASSATGALYEAVVFGLGTASVGSIEAVGEVQLAGRTGITAGDISTDSRMFAVSDGAIALGDLDIGGRILFGGWDMFAFTGDLRGDFDASPTFDSALSPVLGNLTVGNVAATSLLVRTLGGFGAGTVDVSNLTIVEADGDIVITGAIDANIIDLQSLTGAVTTGDLTASSGVTLDAFTNIASGDIDAGGSIALLAGGNIATGNLSAVGRILVDAAGSATLGNVAAGVAAPILGNPLFNIGPGSPVEIFAANIATGNISATGYVGLYTPGTLSTGTIDADHDIVALAGGNVILGAITTPETFTLAGYGNFAALNPPSGFDPSLIFTFSEFSPTGGNATYTGAVSASDFDSWVGGNTSLGQLTSGNSAIIASGGTITLNGAISAPSYVGLASSDIDIAAGASVSADTIGFLSISPQGTFIGDNTGAPSGYRLSQAEIDRTDATAYEFEVLTDRGALAQMTIGDLTMDISTSPIGDIEFWIGNNVTGASGGTIRVIGDASFRVTDDQEVGFYANTIAVDAATGSLSLLDGQGNLSGILGLYAPNIFVAESAILDQLEDDPRYAGYVDDLNAPATVQRPDGVIRAGVMEIGDDVNPLQNLLVQNTGTAALPAGFVVNSTDIGDADGGDGGLEPNSINLVINGQIITPTGPITGVAVRDLLVAEFGSEPFIAGSTINGCLLVGACGGGDSVPPAAVVTPTQIDLLTSDPLGESDFGNEPDIDDNVDGDADSAGSPIDAPQPLFDTKPLIDTALIDDPISGTGNPSLYGSSDEDDEDDDDEEEDDGKDKAKKDEKGDGQ